MTTDSKLRIRVLDALDRVYDGDTSVVDLHALVATTSVAVADAAWSSELADRAEALAGILRSDGDNHRQRELALEVTHLLRLRLAALPAEPGPLMAEKGR